MDLRVGARHQVPDMDILLVTSYLASSYSWVTLDFSHQIGWLLSPVTMARKESTESQSGSVHDIIDGGDPSQREAIDKREVKDERTPVQNLNATEPEGHLHGFRLYLVVLAISIGYFLILLNSTVVVTVC